MLSLLHKVPPLGGCLSLQSEFKCLILCVSRSAFVCTLTGLDSNKWDKKINRRQWEWVCVCASMNANYYVCMCVCVQLESVEAELSCSGPRPDWIEQGMKEKDKRWEEKRWKRVTDHCAEQNIVLLITVRRLCLFLGLYTPVWEHLYSSKYMDVCINAILLLHFVVTSPYKDFLSLPW